MRSPADDGPPGGGLAFRTWAPVAGRELPLLAAVPFDLQQTEMPPAALPIADPAPSCQDSGRCTPDAPSARHATPLTP